MIRHDRSRVTITCEAAMLLVVLLAAARPTSAQRQISADVYLDKARGMWFGELIGNYAGRPREGSVVRGGLVYDVAWNTVLATNPWVADDDTSFEYMYISLLGQSPSPDSAQIRNAWKANIPAGSVYIANRQARWLMDAPPTGESLSPPETGSFRNNMHAAAIDSQITTESLGALVPGMRQRAADLSGTFAGVSNEGFSVHAAQFYAAMYADAATESNVVTIIDDALAVVPQSSRTYQVIDAVRTFHQTTPNDWRACQRMLYDNYGSDTGSKGRYIYWIESTVNVGLTTMALLYGEGDFKKTVEIGVLGGYDNDCNPATAAGLLGMIKGYEGLGTSGAGILAELKTITGNTLYTPSNSYDVRCLKSIGSITTVLQVAQRFATAAEMQITAAGGSIIGEGSDKVYLLPGDVLAAPIERPNPIGPGGLVGRVLAAGGTVTVSASVTYRNPAYDRYNIESIIDGITDVSYNGYRPYWTKDTIVAQPAGGNWYALSFPRDMTFNKVIYYEGDIGYNGINANPRTSPPYGGFFTDLTVEIFRDGQWRAVTGLAFSEALDPNSYYQTIEMAFDPIAGSAVRIRGNAGGSEQFEEPHGPRVGCHVGGCRLQLRRRRGLERPAVVDGELRHPRHRRGAGGPGAWLRDVAHVRRGRSGGAAPWAKRRESILRRPSPNGLNSPA
ncbi:MAG: ADP-ribosylglycohydrolase family protein [Planctomycetia bacterium]|nr:ADP-ribosylglycohydrolase family protein [Planctomycetia bacterium]